MNETYITIPLTRGYSAIVDNEDAILSELKWRAHVDKECNSPYVVREVTDKTRHNGRRTERLHRLVMARVLGRELLDTEYVDHINTNGLDNRRENLRLATKNQNMTNTIKRKDNTSGYKGAVYDKRVKLWCARIYHNKKCYHLGYYKTAKDAGDAYTKKAKELHGEFARS